MGNIRVVVIALQGRILPGFVFNVRGSAGVRVSTVQPTSHCTAQVFHPCHPSMGGRRYHALASYTEPSKYTCADLSISALMPSSALIGAMPLVP